MKRLIANSAQISWRIARPVLLAYLIVMLGMMLLEPSLVYPIPSPNAGDWRPTHLGFEDVWFQSGDGTKLNGWYFPKENSKRAILYCHGNGEHLGLTGELGAQLRETLDASVLVFDYRGYGRSEGKPTEAGCIADGRAAQRWLAKRLSLEPSNIVLMGRSLGGGIAVALATADGAAALIVENTFPSLPAVAGYQYPWLPVAWLMDNQYNSLDQIARYRGPLLQSHGTDDSLIPIDLARKLYEACPSATKCWIEHRGCDHNSACPASYYDTLSSFLDTSTAERQSGPAPR
jgi:fermentation-respiration switch protein FrsA (DUF1100 family)